MRLAVVQHHPQYLKPVANIVQMDAVFDDAYVMNCAEESSFSGVFESARTRWKTDNQQKNPSHGERRRRGRRGR